MARFLYVVARDRLDLFDRLESEFSRVEDIKVVVDRRRTERRQTARVHEPDRRRLERRMRRDLDMELRSVGSFITQLDDRIAAR
jgi:uridine kinase